jgi:hypothetical protein
MASNKIKFKMSIKEVTFEFEGDYEQGRAIQQGISQTMTGLSNLQSRAMGIADANPDRKQIEGRVVDPPAKPHKRKKRKTAGATTGEEGDGNTDNGDGQGAEGDATPRRSGGPSPTALLIELRKSGFFAQKRTMSDILTELQKKGHTRVGNNAISGPLAKLATKDVLRRDHNETGNWVYENGTKEEPNK